MKTNEILLKRNNISFQILTADQRDSTLVLLARAFCTEPVCSSLAELDSSKEATFLDWLEFVDYWMDHCSSNGMSVIAIDEETHRVAGAFIVRDLLMVPEGFAEKYNNPTKALTPWMNFLWHMDAEATKSVPGLGEPGNAVDLWFLGVHPDYRGRKIANDLISCILPLVKKHGYKYATIEATSFFTSKAAEFNKFKPVYRQLAKEWLWRGEPLYVNAKQPHGEWVFWVKDFDDVE